MYKTPSLAWLKFPGAHTGTAAGTDTDTDTDTDTGTDTDTDTGTDNDIDTDIDTGTDTDTDADTDTDTDTGTDTDADTDTGTAQSGHTVQGRLEKARDETSCRAKPRSPEDTTREQFRHGNIDCVSLYTCFHGPLYK